MYKIPKQEYKRLRSMIDKYNTFYNRLKGNSSHYYTSPLSIRNLSFSSKAEYTDFVEKLKPLIKDDALRVVSTPIGKMYKGEYDLINKKVGIINRDRKKRREMYEKKTGDSISIRPVSDIISLGLNTKPDLQKIFELVKDGKISNFVLSKYLDSVDLQSDYLRISERFVNNQDNYLGYLFDKVAPSYAVDIQNIIKNIDPSDFYYLQLEHEELTFRLMYHDPLTPFEKGEIILQKLKELGY